MAAFFSWTPNLFPMKITPYCHQYTGNQLTHYLDLNLNRPFSTQQSVMSALIYRAKNVHSTPKILAMEMIILPVYPLTYLWERSQKNLYRTCPYKICCVIDQRCAYESVHRCWPMTTMITLDGRQFMIT